MNLDLYPIITPGFTRGRPILEVLEAVLKSGAKIVQLRDKEDPFRYAADFRKITKAYGALLIINDSLEAALKAGADGVHLGSKDLDIKTARQKAPKLIIGASATDLKETLAAEAAGADYIGAGPIFPTSTKLDIERVLGIEGLREIVTKVKIPVVAIGGINQSNLSQVLATGCRSIAMITAITEADDIEATTRQFIQKVLST